MADQDPERFLPLTDLAFNILLSLSGDPVHGYALIKELRGRTGRAGLRTGTVYAALARLTGQGLVREVDGPPGDDDARRRYYGATELGLAVARAEARRLSEVLELARVRQLVSTTSRRA